MQNISKKISTYLGEEQNLSEEKIDIICFGIETFLNILVGYLAIFLVAFFLNCLKETIVFCFLIVIYRAFSGGAHCSSWQRCAFAGVLFIPPLVKLSQILIISPYYHKIFWVIASLSILVLVFIYAPKDNSTKPIVTEKHRLRLKKGAISFVIIAIIFQYHSNWHNLNSIIFYSLAWQTMSITPVGVFFVHFIDKLLIKIAELIKRRVYC